jgi:predicted esterase
MGDRLQVVFAQPNKDSITNYFYGLLFDSYKSNNNQLSRISNRYEQLWNCSNNTKFTSRNQNSKVFYEALIYWKDIKPYHPLFMSPVGFNLLFSKALSDSIIIEYCATYTDHLIGGNGMSARYYIPDFKKPGKYKESYYGYSCYSKYIEKNPFVIEMISSFSNKINDTLKIKIRNDKDSIVFSTVVYKNLPKNFIQDKIEIHPDLKKGNYTMEIISRLKPALTNNTFTIIPQIDFKTIDKSLKANFFHLPTGTVNSLYFQYMELKKEMDNPGKYAPSENLNQKIDNFYSDYNQFIKGIDPYMKPASVFKRAYISSTDGSYQPYAIRLPYNYNKSQKYPLIVFLHGSGGDVLELEWLMSNHKYIEIAPNGRDKNKCYTTDISQKDILECIADVAKFYSIDTTNIIIGGLSMGGYGALLTCYNNPSKFKGIFLYSAITYASLAASYEANPDFSKNVYFIQFKKKPVYIHHGKQDNIVPFSLIEKTKLIFDKTGADVTFIPVENMGHGMLTDVNSYTSFFEWIEKVISQK